MACRISFCWISNFRTSADCRFFPAYASTRKCTALRKALQPHFPQVAQIQLTDYKVRILNGNTGTGAVTRVLIDWHDGATRLWSTVGAGTNILDATWLALADGYEFALTAAQPAEKKEALA